MINKDNIRKKCRLSVENIIKEGTTDVELFSRPFEIGYLEIEQVQKEIIDFFETAVSKGKFEDFKFRKICHVLVPKKDLCDFRKCALVDINDEIMYLSIVLLMAKEIEQSRIERKAKRVFSYRFEPKDGYLFDHDYHFTSFREEIERRTKMRKYKVLVECDISNFYDRINLHRIESTLLSIRGIDENLVSILNELLMFWANRDSYGLPIGSNASRILAEAALIEVDNYLLSQNVDFYRFVDDYRIFAKDADTAHKHLAMLSNCLNREGLFLNTHKTKMRDISKKFKIDLEKKLLEGSFQEKKPESTFDKEFKFNLPVIIRGYSGLIPTKFRELTDKEKVSLLGESIDDWTKKILDETIVQPEEMKRFIKIVVAHNDFDKFRIMPNILKKFPQFIPYFVDVMSKKGASLSDEVKQEIKRQFSEWFKQENVPEYILIYLVRVFLDGQLNDKNILLDAFRNCKRVSGNYIGRALLESFNDVLSRGELLEIRDYYTRADQWERRQILRLIKNGLSKGEKRAFFKDILINDCDLFSRCIISEKSDFNDISKISS